MTKELFKDIPGYEGHYQISNKGIVKSIARTITRRDGFSRRVCEKIIEPSMMRSFDPKYGKEHTMAVFCLRKDLKTEMFPAAHAVLLSFFPEEYEVGTYKVTYKDGNRMNVALSNLKFEFYNGRYGGYVEVKQKGRATRKFRTIAQAGNILKFDHNNLFDKKTPEKLKGMRVKFNKPFVYKNKTIKEIKL